MKRVMERQSQPLAVALAPPTVWEPGECGVSPDSRLCHALKGAGMGKDESDPMQYARIDGQESEKVTEQVLEQADQNTLQEQDLPYSPARAFERG